jgi:lipopolysaccharide transport system ATP-binding protein
MKTFRINHERPDKVLEKLVRLGRKSNVETLTAVDDVTFHVNAGEMFGIIGRNGSGKSTLLKILAGIIRPDSGSVRVDGKIMPFLSLGSGFLQELTVRDNIILYGSILGFTQKEMREKVGDIVRFAEIEKFVDTKIKNLSSGMYSRLAFATAVQVAPDVLLVDEVLAVGDQWFAPKSFRKFMEFKEAGKTIILVSHDLDSIERLCGRAMIMEAGRIRAIGSADRVVNIYRGGVGP